MGVFSTWQFANLVTSPQSYAALVDKCQDEDLRCLSLSRAKDRNRKLKIRLRWFQSEHNTSLWGVCQSALETGFLLSPTEAREREVRNGTLYQIGRHFITVTTGQIHSSRVTSPSVRLFPNEMSCSSLSTYNSPVTTGQARSKGHSVTKALERGQMWSPLHFATVPVCTACTCGLAILNGSPQKFFKSSFVWS